MRLFAFMNAPPVHPPYSQSHWQLAGPAQYPYAAPQPIPPNDPYSFDKIIKERYRKTGDELYKTISRTPFPSPEIQRECSSLIGNLHIYRHLFFYTYVHLLACCGSRNLSQLVKNAIVWKEWNSIQQLACYSSIRATLAGFWTNCPNCQHKSLCTQGFFIREDDSDLLCHLLYCGKKSELYEMAVNYFNESGQVVELLWEFLAKSQEIDVLRRLRSQIYRMTRKSSYLPRALRITHASISNKQPLGSGGANGIVTRATMNGQDVAIKRILCSNPAARRECLELFASEAILWKSLQHKNIVPFLGVIVQDNEVCLVSRFCGNGNVRGYMKRHDPRNWLHLAKGLSKDLAEGLEYIHSHEPPIIHGDLKGDNVLVDDHGRARLSDFGQSHASDSGKYLDSTRVGLTRTPPYWMAPELMSGGDRVKSSDKSDIYSFGCILYEMVSGKIPFEHLGLAEVHQLVTNSQRPTRPNSVNANDQLWKTVELCWRGHPEERPSAVQLVSLLH